MVIYVNDLIDNIKYINISNNIMNEIQIKVDFLEDLSRDSIEFTPYSTYRRQNRHILSEWIYHCLINEELVGILKQRSYRFRLYYSHPIEPHKYDLLIVVDVFYGLLKYIIVVTTYEQEIKKRVR